MKNLLTLLFISISVACLGQNKKDTVATLPEATYKRILALQERQKQDQKEIEEALKTAIEFKGFDLANVDWNRTIISIPDKRIFVALIKPKH